MMMKRIGATLVMVAAGIASTSPDTSDGLVDVSSGSTASEQRAFDAVEITEDMNGASESNEKLGAPHKPSPKRATTRRLVYGSLWDVEMAALAAQEIGRSDSTGLDEEEYEATPYRPEDAVISVCDNSAAAAAVRTAADDRYHAAKRKQEAIDGTLVGWGIWGGTPFRGEASGCRSSAAEIDKYDCSPADSAKAHSDVSDANAAYLAAVNSPDAWRGAGARATLLPLRKVGLQQHRAVAARELLR